MHRLRCGMYGRYAPAAGRRSVWCPCASGASAVPPNSVLPPQYPQQWSCRALVGGRYCCAHVPRRTCSCRRWLANNLEIHSSQSWHWHGVHEEQAYDRVTAPHAYAATPSFNSCAYDKWFRRIFRVNSIKQGRWRKYSQGWRVLWRGRGIQETWWS